MAVTRQRNGMARPRPGHLAAVLLLCIATVGNVQSFDISSLVEEKAKHPLDVVLVAASQRTGTVLSGCLTGTLAEHLQLAYTHTDRPVRADVIAKAYYQALDPATSAGLPALLTTGEKLVEYCFDGKSKELPLCSDINHVGCPCDGAKTQCLDSSDHVCVNSFPNLNYKIVHFIRNPIDTVISAYKYHVQDPPPEEWLRTTSVRAYAAWLKEVGVSDTWLAEYSVWDADDKTSYWQHLRALPPGRGIQLEFLRSAPSLFAMARQFRRWHHLPHALNMKVERFAQRFDEAAREYLDFLNITTPLQSAHLLNTMKRCDAMYGKLEAEVLRLDEDADVVKHVHSKLSQPDGGSGSGQLVDAGQGRFVDPSDEVSRNWRRHLFGWSPLGATELGDFAGSVAGQTSSSRGSAEWREGGGAGAGGAAFRRLLATHKTVHKLTPKEKTALVSALMVNRRIEKMLCTLAVDLGYHDRRCNLEDIVDDDEQSSLIDNPFEWR